MGSFRPAVLPVFLWTFANALMLYLPQEKRGQRFSGKRFIERQRAKETINGGSQMDFIDELL